MGRSNWNLVLHIVLLSRLKVSVLVFALLILFSIFTPISFANPDKWFSQLELLEPGDANFVIGDIWIYDNYLNLTYEHSFVAFRIFLARYDPLNSIPREWLEVGYVENQTGFYIYAARCTWWDAEGYVIDYVETPGIEFDGEGERGGSSFQFRIAQKAKNSPNTFVASILDTNTFPPTYTTLMEANFAIHDGGNWFAAGSESSHTDNNLRGHFSELKFSVEDDWKRWKNPDVNNDGQVTITDVAIVSYHVGESYPPCDLNRDGIVDGDDVTFVAWYYGQPRPNDEDLPLILEWQSWTNVDTYCDPPYSYEVISTNEFYTGKRWKNPDVNNDGQVTITDVAIVNYHVGEGYGPYDLNYDGIVNDEDSTFVTSYYGQPRPNDEDLPLAL